MWLAEMRVVNEKSARNESTIKDGLPTLLGQFRAARRRLGAASSALHGAVLTDVECQVWSGTRFARDHVERSGGGSRLT